MKLEMPRFKTEAEQWGISLLERFTLESLCRANHKLVDDYGPSEWADFKSRQATAQYLLDHGLSEKAFRFVDCARKGYVLKCEQGHQFYSPFHCDLRYCPACGPRHFVRLMEKHSPVLEFVKHQNRRGFRLREITLTSRKTGHLSRTAISAFNQRVKITLRRISKEFKGWGAIWVDEVGKNNTNLHAHVLYYGPYIEQDFLAAIWEELAGDPVVWIQQARVVGQGALLYLMKYVSKAPTDNPEGRGMLEVAFHGTRRVHAMGCFYNFKQADKENEQEKDSDDYRLCPECGSKLTLIREYRPIGELRGSGMPLLSESRKHRRPREYLTETGLHFHRPVPDRTGLQSASSQ